ncbi:MAG: type IV pilus secretin PilQ family protein [Pseudomonadales bacterium]
MINIKLSHRAPGRGLLVKLLVCAGMLLPASYMWAATITGIDFNSMPGDTVEVRLDFDGTPPDVKGYSIDRPARIALDLPSTKSALDQKKYTLDFQNTDSVVVLEAADRTRVIVNLVQIAPYETRVEGNSLYLTLGSGASGDFIKQGDSSVNAAVTESSESDGQITNLDFRRGEEGEGLLQITLSDPQVAVDVFKQGRYINLRFENVSMAEELQRNYDVMDFATPIGSFTAQYANGVSELKIEPVGEYEYLAYQTDDLYVVSVRPLTEVELEEKKRKFPYTGEKLSLNFQNIEVRSVLQLIADFTDLNLVASDSVKGKITLRLEEVPWDQALDLVLKTRGLDKRQIGNVLMVAPAAEIAARERREVETNKQLEQLAPLQTEFIRVRYADAKEIFRLFDKGGRSGRNNNNNGGSRGDSASTGSILSPRGSVIVDDRTNSLLVTETAARLEEFRRLISLIDVPVKQVMIEARIVSASSDFSRELGIKWGGASWSNKTVASGSIDSNSNIIDDLLGGDRPALDYPDALVVDLGVAGSQASALAVTYLSSDIEISAELSALESNGAGEIVSQPKLITGDKQKATIKSGQQVPYLQSSSSGRTTVSFKDAVLQLDVTPNITPDDRIIMDLKINQDFISDLIAGEFNSQIPIIDTTELVTQVLVDNGQTIVLGGIFEITDFDEVVKTPFLGDIPYLGRLFKRTTKKKEKSETLIFITPRILSDDLLD